MSSTPTSTGCRSMVSMSLPMRWARGTPRRLMPTRPTLAAPLLRSTISWARRTRVRSISEEDMRRPFSRRRGCVASELVEAGVDVSLMADDDDNKSVSQSARGVARAQQGGEGATQGGEAEINDKGHG